ncbi:hypothetical protein G7Y89_g15163 [Cudoniella acicularis]|uniref:BTB domain-containing protein n=1 Tax=Cudoniella acicularis TaxID=354080 RepID=A0A8H4VNA3_9HELO|nr:hypothetical protein G7Y89_g15163 [Cudoniella acicularis]
MAQEFTSQTSTGKIIAGSLAADGTSNGHQKTFYVRKEILEKSPVMKGWIEDPESMPQSLQKDDALYLPNCDPEVVETLISYLESDHDSASLEEYEFDFDDKVAVSSSLLYRQDPIFYLRIYKLAGSLALDDLCIAALRKIRARKYDTETLVKILIEAEKGKLIEGKRFRDWIIGYMAHNSDALRESAYIRGIVLEGGQKAWAIFSVIMCSLIYVKTEQESMGQGTSPYASTLSPSSNSSGSPPSITRHSRSYLKSYQKSPSRNTSSNRVEKKSRTKGRDLNATVEDAME